MRAARLLGSVALAALLAGPAAAQVATNIVPDAGAGFATGTQVTRGGAVLTIAGGTRAGGNLFHSFTTFDLGQGDTARWTAANPAGVANVINRVTGGRFTTIAGTIDSQQLPNAAFYFINPAGVLMTAGARLNVPGAAYITTAADGVRFADGLKFSTVTPDGSSFSMAAPQSFGFLGAQAPIVIDGVGGSFMASRSVDLKLFASDVGVTNSTFTPRTIEISTLGARTGALSLADPFTTAPLEGQTALINSRVTASATGKGVPSVRVATGAFTQQGGTLTSSTSVSGDAGDLWLRARTADISGVLFSNTGEDVDRGDAGTIRIDVGALHLFNNGQISSSTFGVGQAGDVLIKADSLLIETFASIGSDSVGRATGDAGTVQVDAKTISVISTGGISSSTAGVGDAGAVRITADSVLVDNGGISSATLGGTARGGLVSIAAKDVTLRNFGAVTSLSSGSGDAGDVQIQAGTLSLSNLGAILSTSLGSGGAGDIVLDVGSLSATLGIISSDSKGVGGAGQISIRATGAVDLDNSQVTSDAFAAGVGGDIVIKANALVVRDDSRIDTNTFGQAKAGTIDLTADKLTVDFSEIRSFAAPGSTGNGGTVSIAVGALAMVDQSVITSATFGAGDAGRVGIMAKTITMSGGAGITSDAQGSRGNGGQVAVTTDLLTMEDALISSSTFGPGRAGGVTVVAKQATLSGSSFESGAGTGASGAGGTVQVTADALTLENFSAIVTSTLAAGDAGQVQIDAGKLTVDTSLIASRAAGPATGAANSVSLTGGALAVINGGQIETSSVNAKPAGDIGIALTGPVTIRGDGSHISSENLSARAGAAGSITLSAASIRLADGGTISTNSATGPAGNIRLDLPQDSYLLLEGATDRGVVTTSSGPGTGGRITIADPAAIISNGGGILALGQQRGANVQLSSDYFIRSADRTNALSVDGLLVVDSQVSDVSAGVVIPDVDFLDASGVLRGQCPAARSSGVASQLRLRPFGPYGGTSALPAAPPVAMAGPGRCRFAPELYGARLRMGPPTAADASEHGAPAADRVSEGSAMPTAATVTLSGVEVTTDGAGGPARPRPDWRAGPDADTGLTLEAPGPAGFDAAWVRRQFEANQLIGRPVGLDRLAALTQLINLAFVRNGYVNSGVLLAGAVPRDQGVLQARLVYGRGGATGARVRFGPRGGQGLSARYVRERMAAAQAAPFDALQAEQQFRRLAQDPAVRTVSADLVPGGAPGEATLEVVVDPAPRYDLYASAASSRSPSIGGERYAVGGSMRNLAVSGDLATAEVGVTGGRADVSAGYDAPLFGPSTLVTLRGSRNDAAVVEAALRPLDIRSRDWALEGGLGWRPIDTPLTPAGDTGAFQPARSLTLGVRLAHREQRTWLLGEPFSFSPGSNNGRSHYTAMRLTADYVERGSTQVLALSAMGVQGLGGTHSPVSGALDPAGDFRAVLAQASYARRLAPGLELRLSGAAEWADGPLYTGERFSIGGENTVRGYRENLVLADTGAFGSVELARTFSLAADRRGWAGLDLGAFTGAVFADAGIARNRRGPDPEPRNLASVGASLAWTPSEALFARFTYAKALRRAPIVGERDLQDHGFAFRVTVRPLLLFRPAV